MEVFFLSLCFSGYIWIKEPATSSLHVAVPFCILLLYTHSSTCCSKHCWGPQPQMFPSASQSPACTLATIMAGDGVGVPPDLGQPLPSPSQASQSNIHRQVEFTCFLGTLVYGAKTRSVLTPDSQGPLVATPSKRFPRAPGQVWEGERANRDGGLAAGWMPSLGQQGPG